MNPRHRRNRKKRSILYGVAAAVVASAVAGTVAVASPDLLGGDSETAAVAPGARLQAEFEKAADEFDVPQSVLMAVSYRQTRWESHRGEPSVTGAYNVMGLTSVQPEDVEQHEDKERLAHLNASGNPEIEKTFDAAKALEALPEETVDTDDPRLHTLDEAAELIDSSEESVKADAGTSIRAGAALLAEYQKEATGELPDEADEWYAAVARYSQSPDRKGADLFAKRVFESIRTGESRLTADGQQLTLPADPSANPVKPSKLPLATTVSTTATPTPECPAGLNCNYIPAEVPSTGQRNYTLASRPANGFDVRRIVVHDTEGSYAGTISAFQSETARGSAHYLIRASDGLVTQMVENKNVAWHAGNWTANMHDIGIEHEGYAIKAGSWYTEPQYESSAALVKFLAAKYGVPLDREHIIGHDEVPGQLDAKVAGMHWDAGPYWDWNHYMSLMGAPTGAGGAGGPLKAGQLVRVVPPFTTANQPTLTYGGASKPVDPRPSNFLYLYTSPSTSSTTLTDPYFPTYLWSEGPNWGNKVVAGGTYVVAEAQNDWTAIWYAGKKAWFRNPGGQYTAPVTGGTLVKPVTGAKLYGRSFPEASAYTGTGQAAPTDNPNYLSKYTVATGQAYAKAGDAVLGDDYFGSSQVRVVGKTDVYIPIRYNHRLAWVKSTEVTEATPTAPDAGTTRFNILGRDSGGNLYQYQGTGSASAPFYSRYRVGGGWQQFNAITNLDTLRADGTGDMVARDSSGTLWYYRGSGNKSAPFLTKLKVGTGWGQFNLLVGTGDLTGDGKADMIARQSSTGSLYLYRGTGDPVVPFLTKLKVGDGWGKFNTLVGTGDLNADGKKDIVARDGAGALYLYKGTGSATAPFAARTKIGDGWGRFNTLAGTGDLTGDGKADMIARESAGALYLYKGTGDPAAPFAARTKIGDGWQIYNLLI
ncbi:N-acetylmuramoyl-L-alanine amidase [Streptomyces sp. ISL-10]|uniref:N-acetylmuramoyl-L-alanine amidase n=1 Tax=Streptomyces sp. ISL-10 TaxID=2819172 RepID=UPI001BE59755|nr:N-acetylmuramoyl-L-alanine amidase [Streptomyces sp. ISL-10]MBT2366520.1 N-acetylmuramoyl-L-alanine amidase [Streptomyces sp. ISL-10]